MPSVSVIIPIFKAESSIERCARSLFEQTLDSVEFIFIDDCGDDESFPILSRVLDAYPERKSQTIIHRMGQNSGTAAVRKQGFSLSSGKYIIHCDSDDWVEKDAYESMYNKCVAEDLDMVISDYWQDVFDTHNYWGQQFDGEDLIRMLLNNHLSSGLWNKMVRRDIYAMDDFIFPSENICEDFVYSIQFILASHKVGFIHKGLYHYVYNPNSILHNYSIEGAIERHRQICSNIGLSLGLLESKSLSKKYEDYIVCQKFLVKKGLINYLNDSAIYDLWRHTFGEINWKLLFVKTISFADKVTYVFCTLKVYATAKKLINIVKR